MAKLHQRQFQEAEIDLKLVLLDAPNCVEANMALARLLSESNRALFAQVHLARAGLSGMTPKLALLFGANARANTDVPAAVDWYRIAVEQNRESPEALAGLALALDSKGDLAEADEIATQAILKFPDNPEARRVRAVVYGSMGDNAAADQTLSIRNLRPIDLLDRGRYRDKLGRYDEAWNDWARAKRLLREVGGFQFNAAGFDRMVDDLGTMATKQRQATIGKVWPPPAIGGELAPMFVTGFPRSGTTMIETAIACHSEVIAGDELPFINELTQIAPALLGVLEPYPICMSAASYGENVTGLSILRDWYLRRALFRVSGGPAGTKFFTDKMPLNEIHIPLMLRLFPRSPIFYVRRHPLDIFVSNFSYHITHGWNYDCSLPSIAAAYVAIDALLERYLKLFPRKVWTIKYENFVADPAAELGKAFLHAGLSYEEGGVDFHNSARYSRTISHKQIKEPLYDRSVGRWRNYQKFLAPVLEKVRPICEREGYKL